MLKYTMLTLKKVHCSVKDKTLINVHHLDFKAGKFTAIVGPNGAGKSSFLKTINRDLPYQGEIFLHGDLLENFSDRERAKHLAIQHQTSQLAFNFLAQDVVALGLTPLSLNKELAQQKIKQLMQDTHCWHFAKQFYPLLSGGERQRIHLARVLLQLQQAKKSPVLLLDEPTSSQDIGQQHHILHLLKGLRETQNYCLIAVLHDLNHVLRYSDECIVIHKGEVLAHGQSTEVLSADLIESVWQYKPQIMQHVDGFPVLV